MTAATGKGLFGAGIMLVSLLAGHVLLFRSASRAARAADQSIVFFDLIVTGDDNRYSLSRLQAYLWTVVVAVAYGAVSFASRGFAEIPGNLVTLMGISLGAAVVSTAITTAMDAKAAVATVRAPKPNFARDIFFEDRIPASLDLPRAQIFFWTVAAIATYATLFVHMPLWHDGAATARALPDVPGGMVALMGVSQGAYLGAKVAR